MFQAPFVTHDPACSLKNQLLILISGSAHDCGPRSSQNCNSLQLLELQGQGNFATAVITAIIINHFPLKISDKWSQGLKVQLEVRVFQILHLTGKGPANSDDSFFCKSQCFVSTSNRIKRSFFIHWQR